MKEVNISSPCESAGIQQNLEWKFPLICKVNWSKRQRSGRTDVQLLNREIGKAYMKE